MNKRSVCIMNDAKRVREKRREKTALKRMGQRDGRRVQKKGTDVRDGKKGRGMRSKGKRQQLAVHEGGSERERKEERRRMWWAVGRDQGRVGRRKIERRACEGARWSHSLPWATCWCSNNSLAPATEAPVGLQLRCLLRESCICLNTLFLDALYT